MCQQFRHRWMSPPVQNTHISLAHCLCKLVWTRLADHLCASLHTLPDEVIAFWTLETKNSVSVFGLIHHQTTDGTANPPAHVRCNM